MINDITAAQIRVAPWWLTEVPCVSSVLKTLNRRVARKPNSLSQASDSVAIISAIDVSPPTLDRRL